MGGLFGFVYVLKIFKYDKNTPESWEFLVEFKIIVDLSCSAELRQTKSSNVNTDEIKLF